MSLLFISRTLYSRCYGDLRFSKVLWIFQETGGNSPRNKSIEVLVPSTSASHKVGDQEMFNGSQVYLDCLSNTDYNCLNIRVSGSSSLKLNDSEM